MSESERPRPEYGEYASGDEQSAALARSGAIPTPERKVPAAPTQTRKATPEVYSARSVADRLVTVFLMSFWAVFILGDAASFLNLGLALRAPMKQIGIENYQATELTAVVGIAMLVSQLVVWAVAAIWSYRRLSRKQISWWVPVVLGVLGFILIAILLGSLLATDPSVAPALTKF